MQPLVTTCGKSEKTKTINSFIGQVLHESRVSAMNSSISSLPPHIRSFWDDDKDWRRFLPWGGVETKLKSVPGPGVKRSSVRLQLLMTGQKLGQNYVSSQVKGEKLLWNFPLSPNLLIEVFIENWDPEHYYYYQPVFSIYSAPVLGFVLLYQWQTHNEHCIWWA